MVGLVVGGDKVCIMVCGEKRWVWESKGVKILPVILYLTFSNFLCPDFQPLPNLHFLPQRIKNVLPLPTPIFVHFQLTHQHFPTHLFAISTTP